MSLALFDTHTHFDVPEFDPDREILAYAAKQVGVKALVLIGFVQSRFDDLLATHQQLQQWSHVPQSYLAPGLHPFYIEEHQPEHLQHLEQMLRQQTCVAVGEIGLDTFLKQHKQPELLQKQKQYFTVQLELAQQFDLPVLLHIRKSHADVLALLKNSAFSKAGLLMLLVVALRKPKPLFTWGLNWVLQGRLPIRMPKNCIRWYRL
jgi:TatD DNase family protein